MIQICTEKSSKTPCLKIGSGDRQEENYSRPVLHTFLLYLMSSLSAKCRPVVTRTFSLQWSTAASSTYILGWKALFFCLHWKYVTASIKQPTKGHVTNIQRSIMFQNYYRKMQQTTSHRPQPLRHCIPNTQQIQKFNVCLGAGKRLQKFGKTSTRRMQYVYSDKCHKIQINT